MTVQISLVVPDASRKRISRTGVRPSIEVSLDEAGVAVVELCPLRRLIREARRQEVLVAQVHLDGRSEAVWDGPAMLALVEELRPYLEAAHADHVVYEMDDGVRGELGPEGRIAWKAISEILKSRGRSILLGKGLDQRET